MNAPANIGVGKTVVDSLGPPPFPDRLAVLGRAADVLAGHADGDIREVGRELRECLSTGRRSLALGDTPYGERDAMLIAGIRKFFGHLPSERAAAEAFADE